METHLPVKSVAANMPVKQKVTQLLQLDKITLNDVEDLNNRERVYFSNTCNKLLKKLTGSQREMFLAKIAPVMAPEFKGDIWEYNQLVITEAIGDYMRQYGIMPTASHIADETGLCRQTVATHLKEYKRRPEFAAQADQFKFMAPQVLANVFKFAVRGDMRAAKLYFEMIGTKNPDVTHNNYIQINNTILSQENLTRLTTEQLNQIEGIIKG